MILALTTGEGIGPTGEFSPVVTLLKNALCYNMANIYKSLDNASPVEVLTTLMWPFFQELFFMENLQSLHDCHKVSWNHNFQKIPPELQDNWESNLKQNF